jgi:hypothetical protein
MKNYAGISGRFFNALGQSKVNIAAWLNPGCSSAMLGYAWAIIQETGCVSARGYAWLMMFGMSTLAHFPERTGNKWYIRYSKLKDFHVWAGSAHRLSFSRNVYLSLAGEAHGASVNTETHSYIRARWYALICLKTCSLFAQLWAESYDVFAHRY